MFLRALIAALAIWGMTWASNAHAARMVQVCGTKEVSNCQYSGGSYSCNVEIVPDYSNCWWEDWGYGDSGGDGGDSPTPPDGGGGGGGNYSQNCQSIRGDRPENCGDSDPGNPADFPNSDSAGYLFNWPLGIQMNETLSTAFGNLYGCIGGAYNSVQGCAAQIYAQTVPLCHATFQTCHSFTDDLLLVMGMDYIDDYVRDSVSWSIALPAQIGATPDFDMFPEWMKELVTRARAQMDCHNWHDRMQTAGCTP